MTKQKTYIAYFDNFGETVTQSFEAITKSEAETMARRYASECDYWFIDMQLVD